MIKEYSENTTLGRFVMHRGNKLFSEKGLGNPSPYSENTIIYNKDESQEVLIDAIAYTMRPRSILALVSNQHFTFQHPETLTAWQFNREFIVLLITMPR